MTLDLGLWTLDSLTDFGLWTLDFGLIALQAHAPNQILKPWIGTQAIKVRINFEVLEVRIARCICFFEPDHCALLISQGEIKVGQLRRRNVFPRLLQLFKQSARLFLLT